jgi:hypothetical protein
MRPIAFASAAALALATNVTVSNTSPRLDASGLIIDAHDGNVIFDAASGLYLYYAAGYGDCQEVRASQPALKNACAQAVRTRLTPVHNGNTTSVTSKRAVLSGCAAARTQWLQ